MNAPFEIIKGKVRLLTEGGSVVVRLSADDEHVQFDLRWCAGDDPLALRVLGKISKEIEAAEKGFSSVHLPDAAGATGGGADMCSAHLETAREILSRLLLLKGENLLHHWLGKAISHLEKVRPALVLPIASSQPSTPITAAGSAWPDNVTFTMSQVRPFAGLLAEYQSAHSESSGHDDVGCDLCNRYEELPFDLFLPPSDDPGVIQIKEKLFGKPAPPEQEGGSA